MNFYSFSRSLSQQPKPRRMKAALFGSVALLLILTSPVFGDCPPGSTQSRVERVGDEERTYCKCLPGYVNRQGQCVLKPPTVDPEFFVSPEHLQFVEGELQTLRARQARLENQLGKLDQLRAEQDGYLQEMGEMREQLVYDAIGDTLGVISTTQLLTKVPGLALQQADEIAKAAKVFKAAVEALAHAQSGPDRDRARKKALDAHSTSISLLAKIALPENQKEAISTLVKVSFEVVKAVDANNQTDSKPLGERVRTTMDGIMGVAGAVYAPLGATRSLINATGAGIVLWKIKQDKESLVDALVSIQRARLAADQRLATTRESIKFYELELQKAGKQ
jgi:hypothetical protein